MSWAAAGRIRSLVAWSALAVLLAASRVEALETWNGRIQAHGFFESQLRYISADFGEDWDMTQWYQVFNLEIEVDFIDDGWGPIDLLSMYSRIEVRFDCVYSRGCGMIRSANAFGDRSKSLPRRLSNANSRDNAAQILLRENGRLSGATTDPVDLGLVEGFGLLSTEPGADGQNRGNEHYRRPSLSAANVNRIVTGPDMDEVVLADDDRVDDPWKYVMNFDAVGDGSGLDITDFRFTQIQTRGGSSDGLAVQVLGAWLPKNFVETNAVLADKVNPFDKSDQSGVVGNKGTTPDVFSLAFTNNSNQLGASPILFATVKTIVYENRIESFADTVGLVQPSLGSIDDLILQINDLSAPQLTFLEGGTPQNWRRVRLPRDVVEAGACPGQEEGGGLVCKATNGSNLLELYQLAGLYQLDIDPADGTFKAAAGAFFARGVGSNPFRPVPIVDPQNAGSDTDSRPRGLFYPTPPLRSVMESGEIGSFDFNFSETKRAWNHGASQNDEYELKELYLDIELFDSRLWLRIGKQNIVWGKTELFRTTDQFNPQDFSLASLPSLEEARIPLWAVRGVWSFYEVGPLEDVRVEVAFNFDQFEPNDLGACGEPYTLNVVCQLTFGSFAHGSTGLGVAGVDKPPAPWESGRGWEIGARIEWRWDRFSFALSDFWGYDDFPFIERISTYERNVDPFTGRPRAYGARKDTQDEEGSIAQNPGNQGCDLLRDANGLVEATASLLSYGDGNCLQFGPTDRRQFDEQVTLEGLMHSMEDVWDPDPDQVAPDDPPLNLVYDSFRADPNDQRLVVSECSDRQPSGECPSNPNYVGNLAFTDPDRQFYDPKLDASCTGNPLPSWCRQWQYSGGVQEFQLTKLTPGGAGEGPPQVFLGARFLTDSAFNPRNSLEFHHANQTLFAFVCSTTIGFLPENDPKACAQTVFGSTALQGGTVPLAEVIGGLLAGDPNTNALLSADTDGPGPSEKFLPLALPLITLHQNLTVGPGNRPIPAGTLNPGDLTNYGCIDPQRDAFPCGGGNGTPSNPTASVGTISRVLSPAQEALLGCGPYWGTNCAQSGLDLLNGESSALLQSFIGAEGVFQAIDDLRDRIEDRTRLVEELVAEYPQLEPFEQLLLPNEVAVDLIMEQIENPRSDGYRDLLVNGPEDPDNPGQRLDPRLGAIDLRFPFGIDFVEPAVQPAFQPGTLPYVSTPTLAAGQPVTAPTCTTNNFASAGGYFDGIDADVAPLLPGCGRKWRGYNTSNGEFVTAMQTRASYFASRDDLVDDNTDLRGLNVRRPYLDNPYGVNAISEPANPYLDVAGSGIDPRLLSFTDPSAPLAYSAPGNVQSFATPGRFWDAFDDGDPDLIGVRCTGNGNPPPFRAGFLFRGVDPTRHCFFQDTLRPAPGPNAPLNLQILNNPVVTPMFLMNPGQDPGSGHPFTGHPLATEMAGASWNFEMLIVAFADDFISGMRAVGEVVDPDNTMEVPAGAPGSFQPLPEYPYDTTERASLRQEATYMFAFSGEDVGDIPDYNDNDRDGDRAETRFQLAEWCPSRGERTFIDDNGDLMGLTLEGTGLPGDNKACTPGQPTGRIFTFAPIPLWEENRPVTDGRTFGDNGKDPGNAHCSFIQPQYCALTESLYSVTGQAAPYLRAGGNGNWGRRTFQWHGGGEILLKYDRRNVLGFSMDFAEDVTKTNWGVEFTWIGNQPISDNESPDNISFVDSYNLTISMDRPTFVNFLNANRTFFVTTQWFFQYRNLKDSSWARIPSNGPWNILGILAIQTGYFQDRLLPNVTFVYDVNSVSGAVLPQFTYRFSENFSATVGAGIFFGRTQLVDMPLNSIAPAANRVGANQFQDGVENLLAVVRDRDELFLKLRYTF